VRRAKRPNLHGCALPEPNSHSAPIGGYLQSI
jgi:hypothetical protein